MLLSMGLFAGEKTLAARDVERAPGPNCALGRKNTPVLSNAAQLAGRLLQERPVGASIFSDVGGAELITLKTADRGLVFIRDPENQASHKRRPGMLYAFDSAGNFVSSERLDALGEDKPLRRGNPPSAQWDFYSLIIEEARTGQRFVRHRTESELADYVGRVSLLFHLAKPAALSAALGTAFGTVLIQQRDSEDSKRRRFRVCLAHPDLIRGRAVVSHEWEVGADNSLRLVTGRAVPERISLILLAADEIAKSLGRISEA